MQIHRVAAAAAALVAALAGTLTEAARDWSAVGCILIQQDEFSPASSNRVLDCRTETLGYRLKTFPDDTADPAMIEINPAVVGHLWLSGNAISTLNQGDLAGFANLRQLFLDGNNVRTVADGTFDDVPELEFILLNNNKLRDMPLGLGSLRSLVYLDVSSNLISTLGPGNLAGLRSLRYFNVADNRLSEVQCGTFNQVQASLNYLNTSANSAACGIQKYTTVNPMIAGSDATITCACPSSATTGSEVRTGSLGFCDETNAECSFSPPLLKLTAKAISIDQGWEKISDRLSEWVAPTNQLNGQLNAIQELTADDKNEITTAAGGLSTSATALVAVCIVCVAALIGVVVVRQTNRSYDTSSSISDMTSSYASSDTTGYRKQLQHAGHSQSTVGGAVEVPPSHDVAQSMHYLGDQGHLRVRTGKLEAYSHSLGADSMSSSTTDGICIADRPTFDAHAAPPPPGMDGSIQIVEGFVDGETPEKLEARRSFYNMFK